MFPLTLLGALITVTALIVALTIANIVIFFIVHDAPILWVVRKFRKPTAPTPPPAEPANPADINDKMEKDS